MRTWTVAVAAAGALLVGCTSSGTHSAPTPAPTSATSTSPTASSAAPPSSTVPSPTTPSTSGTPRSTTPTKRTSSAPPAPTAQTYLLSPADIGSGFQATTRIDAAIPSLCGGGGAADRGKPIRSTAQVGFFDGSRRLLVAEKVNTYRDVTTASQINSVVLAFDSCGSAAKYNGLKATYSASRDLSGAVMDKIDSGAARDVHTSQANIVFETLRKRSTLVQLTFTSIGGAPPAGVVEQITAKAAAALS